MHKRNKIHAEILLSALLTLILLLIIYKVELLAPFGNKSLATMDARIQYLDFFAYLKDVLENKADIKYTFGKSLGGSAIAVFSYYLSSPFNILVMLFEKENLNVFFDLLILLKLVCCSITCTIFLAYRFEKIGSKSIVLLSVSYSLMQYNFAQSSNIMWLDGVYMLPIILLGVYYVVVEKSIILLSISVGLSILFNWYIAGINCMFSFLWFIIEQLYCYNERTRSKGILKNTLAYFGSMILGIGISACLFLPTIFALREGKGSFDLGSLQFSFLGNLLTIVQNLTSGATSSKGSVALYCGCFVIIGCFSYFFLKMDKINIKRIDILLLITTVLMFYFSPFSFALSLFRAVNSYWYRYSYLGIFVMIYFAAKFYERWDNGFCDKKTLLKGVFCYSGLLLILDFGNHVWELNKTYLTILFALLIAAVLLKIEKNNRRNGKIIDTIVLCMIVFLDLGYNAHNLISVYQANNVDEYSAYVTNEKALIGKLKDYDNGFYRINQTYTRYIKDNNLTANYNEALAYNFNSIISYTSTPDNVQLEFLDRLGYRKNGAAMNIVNTSILPVDSLLGVKYILSYEPINGLILNDKMSLGGENVVYENPYCIPNAFIFNIDDMALAENNENNPFTYLNILYGQLLGENAEIFKEAVYQSSIEQEEAHYQIKVPDEKVILYGNILTKKELNADLLIDGEFRSAYSEWLAPSVFYIPCNEGESVDVILKADEIDNNIKQSQFYFVELDQFKEIIDQLNSRKVDSIKIEPGKVTGMVYGKNDEALFLNIPYHKQWNIKVNGIEIEPLLLGDCLMCIPLVDGENIIEMDYYIQGLREGAIVTIFSIIVIIFREGYKICRQKKENYQ